MQTAPYTTSDLVLQLSKVRHFSQVKHEELEQIISLGRVQSYPAGEIIFQEQCPGEGLFVLLAGRVHLCKLSPQGQIAILAAFDPVVMFNEVPALDRGPNAVTAVSVDDSVVWRLDPDHLELLVTRHPQVGLGILHVLATRNRSLVEHFEDLSFRSVLARAAKLLLTLSADGAQPIDRRKHPVHQLAARIATVPGAFSRSLKVFRHNGDIRSSGAQIQVINPNHLKEIAEIGPRIL